MGTSAESSARIPVFLNARAGGDDKSASAAQIQKLFGDRGLSAEVLVIESGKDIAHRVREAMRGACIAVAGGGDGTINAVASALDGRAARLGVLPLGTLNHFARDLGIPIDLEQAVGVIAAGVTRRVDVGAVNDRLFLNNSSIGVYPSIVHAREALQAAGHRKWSAFAMAATRVLGRQGRIVVRMQADGRSSTWHTPFVMVGNNEYDVTGLRLAGRSRLDAGRLFAYVAPHVRVLDLPKAIALEWFGRVLHHDANAAAQFRMIAAREFWIDAEGKVIDVQQRQKSLMETFRNVRANGADLDPKTGVRMLRRE
jgi:diacylglycerol kinase family enzyme